VAKIVADVMPNATDDAKSAEAKRRCQALASAGLLIEQWDLDALGADLAWCGRDGSPIKVHRIQSVVLTGGAYREFPPTEQACMEMIAELIEDHTLG
jgi:electron transfer flavoprotein beta subunit